eukprot:GFUD01020527.1.p1 GENE.GFUD01020527.1~~GFUD01020527.1.p1  ORF type:complete len:460 (+),score=47.04 GFUD01020527.1:248-1627(+)
MAPNIKDQLPIINRVLKWFTKDGLVIESPLFKLHHQMSTFIIMIGFIFISVENYLDTKAILCHTGAQFSAYAKSYCWIHGTAYVRTHLQGTATGCFVDQSRLQSEEDAPITAYYLWLPYLLSLLFAFAKLPHSIWKRFFENNLIVHILGGQNNGQNPNQNQHQNQNENKQENHNGGQGPQNQTPGQGKNKNRSNRSRPLEIAQNFVDFRSKYNHYHKKFAFWEATNILTVLLSMQTTHWILNYKFFPYGLEVIEYISSYGQQPGGRSLHDPMCELFPTEVACNINIGSTTGAIDRTNFLCILGNNLFNQKYFFVLWLWWVLLLFISILGIFYRWGRIAVPSFSRYLLARKIHGKQLQRLHLTSGDCFVLEMVLDNMSQTPKMIDQMLEEVEKKLTEIQRSKLHWKIAEVEDGYKGENFPLNTSGYKGENFPLNTSGYKPENFPINPEVFPLNASAPTDV